MQPDPRFAQAVEETIATYDRIAPVFAERTEEMPAFWADRMERFLDLLADAEARVPLAALPPPGPDAALEVYLATIPVLDAGCGPGRDARALAAHGLPVLAGDLSAGMLNAARERTALRLPRGAIRYAVMDLRRLELPDACCRGVWCSASLLHVPKHAAPRAMAELARVARRGAPLALILKLAGAGAEQTFQPNAHGAGDDARRFFAYYSPEEARRLMEASGWAVREVAQSADPPPPDAPGWVALLATRR